jgi:hypothetical protein
MILRCRLTPSVAMTNDVPSSPLPHAPHRWLRYVLWTLLALPVVIVLWLALVPMNLTLYISNQSSAIDPVDIQVEIDGQLVANDQFRFADGHNWQRFVLPLRPGRHSINAKTVKGDSIFRSEFSVFWNRWAVLDYWYCPDQPDVAWRKTPRHFTFDISHFPPHFR